MRCISGRSAGWLVLLALLVGGPAMAEPDSSTHGLIRGMDGGLYAPYRAAVVQQAQDTLKQAGLYAGSANGVLDEATMKALAGFQKSHGMVASGIPTPRTRAELMRERQRLASAEPTPAPAPVAKATPPEAPAPVAAPPPAVPSAPSSARQGSPMKGSTEEP